MESDIAPALQAWLQNKVESEQFGGLYDAQFHILSYLKTSHVHEEKYIKAQDEKRIEIRSQLMHDFIAKDEYLTEDIGEIDHSLENILQYATLERLDEFGEEKLISCFSILIEKAKQERFDSSTFRLMLALNSAAYHLTDTRNGQEHTQAELSIACKICMLMLLNSSDKHETGNAASYLRRAGDQGYKEAKNIIKYGTGKIPMDVLVYKDKFVNCSANDIDKVVTFKIKEESSEAYKAMVDYLTKLLKHDFPGEYKIKFDSKVKISGSTKTSTFFANAAQYPEVHSNLRAYIDVALDDYNYYSDAEDEEAVTCGGYAAMALAFADPIKNFDVAIKFLEHSDLEHAITSRYFIDDFAAVCEEENKKKIEAYHQGY